MRALPCALFVFLTGCEGGTSTVPPATTPPDSGGSPPTTVGSCPTFPSDNEWNRDVSHDEVDPASATYMAAMNAASKNLHPDFGSNLSYGIPWVEVPATQPKVQVEFEYAEESDPGPYPIPADAPVEGGEGASGDRHVIVVDRDACKLYEMYDAHPVGSGWNAGSGAIFDLRSNALRPDGWTSADAAGLPIFPGLAKRGEAENGTITHALRFTVARTRAAYIHPATHFASAETDTSLPPMGMRVRLKSDFDVSTFHGHSKVILAALTKYGMLVADNGSDWYISGERNGDWDDDDLEQLKGVPASAFEVVKRGQVLTTTR